MTILASTSPVVASVPTDHPYIRHLAPVLGGGPVRLADPDPLDPTRSTEQRWWPPAVLDPAWILDPAHEVDVVHVHFGFDARTPQQLEEFVAAVRRRGWPLVLTVHDLRNPHHAHRAPHDAALDVLVPAADAVLTLTPGAAAVIRERWDVVARVVPHPHVVALPELERRVAARRATRRPGEFRVGLHVKSVRASMDPLVVLPVLAEVVAELPGAVLQVDAHPDTGLDRELDALSRPDHVELRRHGYFSEQQFHDYLDALDVSVLPYRFGTHSGWLEACRDLDTTVIVPTCGFYAEQGPVLSYGLDEDHFDPESLRAAVRTAYADRPSYGATSLERRRQRDEIAAAHDEVYRMVRAS